MNVPEVMLGNLLRHELLALAQTEASTPLERALLALILSEGELWERGQSEEVRRVEGEMVELKDQAGTLARKLRDLADDVESIG